MRTVSAEVAQATRLLDAYLVRAGTSLEGARSMARLLARWERTPGAEGTWAQLAALEAQVAAVLAAQRARADS
jgi:hypothetical protein